jgi:hypothetical protein
MANISRNSYNEPSLYDKVIQQQGMPFTDYDFNEAQDIQRVKLRRIVSELMGDGAIGTGWKVQATSPGTMAVNILDGSYYIGGYRVLNNSIQTLSVAAAPGTGTRTDSIYLHFKEIEIDSTQDPSIKHPSLTLEPTRRTKIQSDVNYLQGSTTIPSNTATDFYVLLATILVSTGNTTVTNAMITDSRVVKAIFTGTAQSFNGTITALGLNLNGPGTIQGNLTYQPTGIWSTSQTNSLIHNPLFNSSGSNTVVAQMDFIRTSTTDGSYDGEVSLKTRTTGSALTEAVRFKKDQSSTFAGLITASNGLTVPATKVFTNSGTYAGSPLVTSITGNNGITVTNPVSPGAATLGLSAVPNTVLSGPLVSSITAGSNISVTNPSGVVGAATVGITGTIPVANGGTGSATQNFVDLTTAQTIAGIKTFSGTVNATTLQRGGFTAWDTGNMPNSVTAITAGTNITVTNPTGAGASTVGLSGVVGIANGGTGSGTQNFVDLTTIQSIGGAKTFTAAVNLNAGGTIAAATTITNAGTITGGTINASTAPWSGISSKPTTISGYGITDNIVSSITAGSNITVTNPTGTGAATVGLSGVVPIGNGGTGSSTQNFVDLSTVQTIAGAKTFSGAITLNGGGTIPLAQTLTNAGTITNTGTISGGTINASSVPWSGIASKPTTISGYGITDNVVTSITSGSNITVTNPTGAGAATVGLSGVVPIGNGGTGSSTQNFVDLTTAQTVAGAKTFSGAATFNAGATIPLAQTLTVAGSITNTGTISGGTINASSVPWSGITTKPTTIAGYAISDNIVTSITAGGNITVTNPTGAGAATVGITGVIPIGNGGTGSNLQNFVDLTTAQTVAGAKTFSGLLTSTGGFVFENRTTDPASPVNGQVWFRSDL